MMGIDFLNHLIPDVGLIFTPEFEVIELGVWFWLFMLFITGLSIAAVFYHRINFSRRLSRVKKLIEGQDRATLAPNRKATLNKALDQDPKVTGALWREFDESLVYSFDKTRLSNTLDAEHFFNSATLAYGLTSSRLLSAAPTFLTAIGVLGTFIGLTLGLKDLQVNAEEVDTLKSGVSAMINGAAVAFMTSVWGVGLSLFLNMFEKIIERGALSKIRDLQQQIDFLYPRLPAEHSLVQIAASSEDSKEALQELHERIGDRLQETVSGMSESMQQAFTDAMNNVMAPAIKTLVDNASSQSTDVLEQLVSKFMGAMQSAGREQGESMSNAAEGVRASLSSMAEQMEALFQKLDEQQNKSREHTQSTSEEFARLLDQQRQDAIQRQEQMEQKFNQLMEQLSERVGAQFEKADENERKRAREQAESQREIINALKEQLSQFGSVSADQIKMMQDASNKQRNELGETFESSLSALKELIAQQTEAASNRQDELDKRLGNQVEELAAKQQQLLAAVAEGTQQAQQQMVQMAEQHRQLMDELNSVTRSVESSSQNMNNSSTQLGLLSTNLKQVTDVLDKRLEAVTSSLEGVGEENRSLAEHVIHQAQTLKQLQSELHEATIHFEKAAQSAEHGFQSMNQHQQTFLEGVNREFERLGTSLKQQVEAIEQQAAEWLRSYSNEVRTQVSERMEQWNETTLQFADQMRSTVSAISGIVDDLEQKR